MASPAPLERGRVRLLEPEGSSRTLLRRRLTARTYDKPFVADSGPLRYLHFGLDNVQSVMRRDEPAELCLGYTRRMMSFLLFEAQPRRILMLGLGGGSLPKFCYRHLPRARIRVLEIDPHVIALRDEFQIPADDRRFTVVRSDCVRYIARRSVGQDVILLDACDSHGMARALEAPDVYPNLRRRLSAQGVLVINVCGDPIAMASHLARIRGVFGEQLMSLPAREDGNMIVFAFRHLPEIVTGARLDRHARVLEGRFGLAFPRYARQLERGATHRY